MLYVTCDLPFKEQTNLMQAVTWSSAISRDGESPNNLMSVSLSEVTFIVSEAFFFPIPNKLLTESQPVIKWTAGRASTTKNPRSVYHELADIVYLHQCQTLAKFHLLI